jgi:hypothetical protein
MDDGSTGYLAFAYPNHTTIDLRVDLTGCAMVSNGHILTNADALHLFLRPRMP